jgi:hypothetical protein
VPRGRFDEVRTIMRLRLVPPRRCVGRKASLMLVALVNASCCKVEFTRFVAAKNVIGVCVLKKVDLAVEGLGLAVSVEAIQAALKN